MKVGQKIIFWVATDDSCRASECFGVEPQNDWFDIQYYPEQINGIIIWNKGLLLAQQFYKGKEGVEMRGKVFDISRNGIKVRIESIKSMLERYDMTDGDFFDNDELSFDSFFEIKVL